MAVFNVKSFGFSRHSMMGTPILSAVLTMAISMVASIPAGAAITWDAGANSQWWFNPVNWSRETPSPPCPCLPPTQASGDNPSATDTQINIGNGGWNITGEGVVYDPVNDPFFAAAAGLQYPTGSPALNFVGSDYGPQHLNQLYISRNTIEHNLLTIKSGDLVLASTTVIGRSGSNANEQNLGRVNQVAGRVRLPLSAMDLGLSEVSGWGNGTYDYRSGILEVSLIGGAGIRIAHGTDSGVGAGGVGKFIIHNPNNGGYVRTWDYTHVSYRGIADGMLTSFDPNGITRGVAISQFHFENGGVRPVQIARHLTLNNGVEPATLGTMSSRLELILNAAPQVNGSGVPQNLGLFDVDFDIGFGSNGGTVRGFGDINGDGQVDAVFANPTGTVFYTEGSTVSANFGATRYDWRISYTGNITWLDADNSVIASITGPGTGRDVVLIGLGSVTSLLGDFNNDGLWNCADINSLSAAIAANSTNLTFDMNGDGQITLADITAANVGWLAVGGSQNPTQTGGNPFRSGDANLDGVVDGSDFGLWNSAKFTANTNWCNGNFNADSVVDGSDFGIWNANKFTSSMDGAAVPEPAGALLLIAAGVGLGLVRRQR